MGSTGDARKGVVKKPVGSHLNNKIRQLTLRIDELELLIDSLKAQGWEQRRRQEILLTLLMNQEELQRIFESGWPSFTEDAPRKQQHQQQQQHQHQQQHQQQQQQQQQQQLACGATAPTWNELLASAPAWQVDRVQHMRSGRDWSALFTDFFRRGTPLLELASRGAAVSSGGQSNGEAEASAAAAPAVAEPPWDEAAQRRTPDVAAAARQELQTLIKDVMQLSSLAAFLNTQPLRDAVFCNHLTGQLGLPPPGHWQQVVARLQLTPQQVVIMRFVAEAMGAAVQQEVEDVNQLCQAAARLSLADTVETREPSLSNNRSLEQQAQEQPPGASASSSESSSGAPAPSKDTPVGLMRQLKRATQGNNITMQMVNALAFDSLSPLQWAMATIAGFPFMTTPYALGSAVIALADQGGGGAQSCPSARLLQQDAERHMLQRREQLWQRLQEWRLEPKHQQLLVALQLEGAAWLLA